MGLLMSFTRWVGLSTPQETCVYLSLSSSLHPSLLLSVRPSLSPSPSLADASWQQLCELINKSDRLEIDDSD